MNKQVLEYDLYIDESGDFKETSQIKSERLSSLGSTSQLAGLLVPRNQMDQAASEITTQANSRGKSSPARVIHATDRIKESFYNYLRLVEEIIKGVHNHREWQCVRLVNVERVSYFDRATTYPNLVAELTLRAFQQKAKENPAARICIRLIDPKYKLKKAAQQLSPHEYFKRISEYLGFAEVRYGLTREGRNWRFDGIISREYKHTPALQICDVLSHASADNFDRLHRQKNLADMLRKMFGDYDFTLTIRELFERVDELTKEHSFGMALMVLAESLVHASRATKQDREFAGKLEERLVHIVGRLGRMDFRGRDPQLALLIGWLDQLVGQQRLLDKGYEIAQWLLVHVEVALRTHLSSPKDEATLDWFAYSLRRWALTACNHKGVLRKGQTEVEAMKSLQPSVATQWERIPLVMDGLIAQAVHYTDCFEFDQASKRMKFVADSLKMQSNHFHELMPQEFPAKLRFDLRARALGTLVQSEILAGALDPARLELAREASAEAVREFTSFSDRARQYQYRCHLETVARDFATARKYLVRSLEGTDAEPGDYSHRRIADLIREFSIDPEWKSEFTLLHWLRIGAYACLDAHQASDRGLGAEPIAAGDQSDAESGAATTLKQTVTEFERDEFFAALDHSEQLDSDACQGRLPDYPAHSILRFVAVIYAARGQWEDSLTALQRLHALDPIGKEQFVLAMILVAAQAEVSVLMCGRDRVSAHLLLDSDHQSVSGLRQLIQQVDAKRPNLVAISSLSQRWLSTINHLSTNEPTEAEARAALLRLAAINVY